MKSLKIVKSLKISRRPQNVEEGCMDVPGWGFCSGICVYFGCSHVVAGMRMS